MQKADVVHLGVACGAPKFIHEIWAYIQQNLSLPTYLNSNKILLVLYDRVQFTIGFVNWASCLPTYLLPTYLIKNPDKQSLQMI